MRIAILVAWSALTADASAQGRELFRIPPPDPGDQFGRTVAALDDLDGDGVAEIAIGAPMAGTGTDAGRVYVFSGRDGALLRTHEGVPPTWTNSENYGDGIERLGDLTSDGVDEYAIYAPLSTRIEFIDGAAGTVLKELILGGLQGSTYDTKYVANPGDLDGDGLDDLLVAHTVGGGAQRGRVFAISTATFAPLFAIYGENPNDHLGMCVRAPGDVDGDGLGDLLIGAPDYPHYVSDGAAYVYSSGTGLQQWKLEGRPYEALGLDLGIAGDVDGDGAPEVLVTRGYLSSIQFVEVRSGRDGTLLGDFVPDAVTDTAGIDFGPPVDVDGDGQLDALIAGGDYADRTAPRSLLFAYDPRSDRTLARVDLGSSGFSIYKASVAALGDVDGDGFQDVVVARPDADAIVLTFRSAPTITSVTPPRGRFDADTPITLTGSGFALAQALSVDLGGTPATDAVVVDDATITCTLPTGEPGPLAITVSADAGIATLADAFARTPATLLEGDFARGGAFTLRTLCDPGDVLFGIVGLPPEVTLAMPPYAGALRILPYSLYSAQPAQPGDEFDLAFDIPDDPALIGLEVLFQSLAGPKLGGRSKSGAWTNAAHLTIE